MGPASGSAGKKPENHVHRFARLAAQPLSGVGRVTVQAVYPDRPQASLAEDSPSFSFCLADCRGRCLPDVVNQYRNWETGFYLASVRSIGGGVRSTGSCCWYSATS